MILQSFPLTSRPADAFVARSTAIAGS